MLRADGESVDHANDGPHTHTHTPIASRAAEEATDAMTGIPCEDPYLPASLLQVRPAARRVTSYAGPVPTHTNVQHSYCVLSCTVLGHLTISRLQPGFVLVLTLHPAARTDTLIGIINFRGSCCRPCGNALSRSSSSWPAELQLNWMHCTIDCDSRRHRTTGGTNQFCLRLQLPAPGGGRGSKIYFSTWTGYVASFVGVATVEPQVVLSGNGATATKRRRRRRATPIKGAHDLVERSFVSNTQHALACARIFRA